MQQYLASNEISENNIKKIIMNNNDDLKLINGSATLPGVVWRYIQSCGFLQLRVRVVNGYNNYKNNRSFIPNSKRLIESNLIGGPTYLPILNDLAPPLIIHNIPYYYYVFGLRESEGHFLFENLQTWPGFLRLIQYLSLAQEKKERSINKNKGYLIEGHCSKIFIYITFIFNLLTSIVVIIALDFNLNNGGLSQWLLAGFISISIALMLSILVYRKIIGISNNIWKTLLNLLTLSKDNKYKLFRGFLVTIVTFFFIYLGYTYIILYIFQLEKVNYTLRLIIAFSLIVPIGCIFAIIKSRKVIISQGNKHTYYDLNTFSYHMLNSVSIFRIVSIITGIGISSYFDIPGKISGILERGEINIETKFIMNKNTIRPLQILSRILESILSIPRSIALNHTYVAKPNLIKATPWWLKDGAVGVKINWVEYNNSPLKGGLAKMNNLPELSDKKLAFVSWCLSNNIHPSNLRTTYKFWSLLHKYNINPQRYLRDWYGGYYPNNNPVFATNCNELSKSGGGWPNNLALTKLNSENINSPLASFEDTPKSGHNQDFNKWCKIYNISPTSKTGDNFLKWCFKYGINPSWILYPFHPEWKSPDYVILKFGTYYLGGTPILRGGSDNSISMGLDSGSSNQQGGSDNSVPSLNDLSNPEPLFIDILDREPLRAGGNNLSSNEELSKSGSDSISLLNNEINTLSDKLKKIDEGLLIFKLAKYNYNYYKNLLDGRDKLLADLHIQFQDYLNKGICTHNDINLALNSDTYKNIPKHNTFFTQGMDKVRKAIEESGSDGISLLVNEINTLCYNIDSIDKNLDISIITIDNYNSNLNLLKERGELVGDLYKQLQDYLNKGTYSAKEIDMALNSDTYKNIPKLNSNFTRRMDEGKKVLEQSGVHGVEPYIHKHIYDNIAKEKKRLKTALKNSL